MTSTIARRRSTRTLASAALLPLAVLPALTLTAGSASAATTDPVLYGYDTDYVDSKHGSGNATYTRSSNQLRITATAATPHLFAGARTTVTAKVVARDMVGTPVVLWQESGSVTACAKLDPVCPSTVSRDFEFYPSNHFLAPLIQQHGSWVEVETHVQ